MRKKNVTKRKFIFFLSFFPLFSLYLRKTSTKEREDYDDDDNNNSNDHYDDKDEDEDEDEDEEKKRDEKLKWNETVIRWVGQ